MLFSGEVEVLVDGKSVLTVQGLAFGTTEEGELEQRTMSHVHGMHFQTFFGGEKDNNHPLQLAASLRSFPPFVYTENMQLIPSLPLDDRSQPRMGLSKGSACLVPEYPRRGLAIARLMARPFDKDCILKTCYGAIRMQLYNFMAFFRILYVLEVCNRCFRLFPWNVVI